MEKNVKNIYLHIMDMHDQKLFIFNQERIAQYSEADYIVKFWASAFETFFGTDEHLFIHWGDTQSSPCKRNNLKISLDMRFMIMKNSKYIMDGANCEYARKAIPGKFFKDKLKLILASIAYINDIIINCPYLEEDDYLNIKIPLVQIMGFEGSLSIMRLKDKGVYVVEEIAKLRFPTTKKQLREGGIKELVKVLSLLKHLLDNLQEIMEEEKFNHKDSKMTGISNESRPPQRNSAFKDWVTEIVVPPNSGDDEEEDEEYEDEEKEDEEEEESKV
ncbi:uncharacterized protein EV154DRAFT_223478 [Mucor mucedo]|uniref:uncharacterized protein n=1 Tax=Mucor mucedo TaxID=29922 RepID=UPI00221F7EFE|nr:uncharacterized protein EV154DRAFT_223478 [Mucor mucedo]KAI7891393.1 hypothetical protein EV154DRAFT_223478 [Mucor mucedo]